MPRRRPAAWPFLLFCLSALAAPAAFSQVLTVGDSPQPLVMDGHLKDWPASRMITLDDPGQVVEGGFFWKGPDQFGARVFLTYDAEYLYLAVLVTREGPPVNSNKPSALWNGDCLELFLSTDPGFASQGRLTRADYHVGISPGTDCQDPQAWCFNLEEAIPGSQVTAKISKKGYLMEAALPLDFFRGLQIAPGGTCGFDLALDEGGPVGGNRLARLDYLGHRETWLHPAGWAPLKWTGATQVTIPPPDESDENAILVRDGTRGAGFLGKKSFTGRVVDGQGRPLAGAEVSLWPADAVTVTDGSGSFALGPVKAYRKTLLYARHDGYFTSLAAPQAAGRPVTLCLSSMPVTAPGPQHARSPLFFGAGFSLDAAGRIPADLPVSLVRGLGLGVLYLRGGCLAGLDDEAQKGALVRFQDYARALGAEPVVEVPLGPDAASRAVS
ncbi:MAG TPA: sugar-binding protein, partial [bacterium]|nr:sugar-binding protein [bacterium]